MMPLYIGHVILKMTLNHLAIGSLFYKNMIYF